MDGNQLPSLTELKRRGHAVSQKVQANIAELHALSAALGLRLKPRHKVYDAGGALTSPHFVPCAVQLSDVAQAAPLFDEKCPASAAREAAPRGRTLDER